VIVDKVWAIRVRFSLRFLLIVMTVVAVFLGTVVERARQQREAVAWVRSQGGHISYDYERPEADGSYPRGAKPPGPEWLRELIGVDYFATVEGVVLDRDEITDLAPLANLPQLRSLGLMIFVDPKTDLSPIQTLKNLKQLELRYTGLDADRIAPIRAALPNCEIDSYFDLQLEQPLSQAP
jgi:hypothetical protein